MSKKFDLTVQKRNKKGQVVSSTPYRLFIENGVRKFERPVGSGVFYGEDGALLSKPKVEKMPEETKKSLQALVSKEMDKE